MREPTRVYTIEAVANRLKKSPEAVKQKIKRYRDKKLPLAFDGYVFVLLSPSNGYIALEPGEELNIIRE